MRDSRPSGPRTLPVSIPRPRARAAKMQDERQRLRCPTESVPQASGSHNRLIGEAYNADIPRARRMPLPRNQMSSNTCRLRPGRSVPRLQVPASFSSTSLIIGEGLARPRYHLRSFYRRRIRRKIRFLRRAREIRQRALLNPTTVHMGTCSPVSRLNAIPPRSE